MPRLFTDYRTEFILTVRRATTGEVLWRHEVAAMDLTYTWELKLGLSEHLNASSPFALRLLQGAVELDDTQHVRAYVHSGLLEVEILTQTCRTCTRRDEASIGEMAGLQQATRLWLFLVRGIQVPQVLRVGRQRRKRRENLLELETLLRGYCDPNEFGSCSHQGSHCRNILS